MLWIILLLTVFENFSAGIQINIPNDTIRSKISENILVEVNPTEKNVYALNIYTNPVVVITSPENGTNLPTPYLEILGYAFSSDGLNCVEWEHYWNDYPIYHGNEIFNTSMYIGFRIQIFYLQPGTHKVVVRFYDINNHSGSDSVIVYYGNLPPEKPNKPSGPIIGSIGGSYSYSTNTTDPNNDTIKYGWDWNGDGTVDQWTNVFNSGVTITTAHTFTSNGTYNIKVMAEDEYGAQSIFSETLQVIITSNPPKKPNTPDGPLKGKPGVSYTYQTSTTDPDGGLLYYTWDWGDGTSINWTGPYNSTQTVAASHIWSAQGSFSVKVKAKDTTGAESVWSDPFPITMPYSYTKPLPQFLESLFQRFPNAFPILRQLIG